MVPSCRLRAAAVVATWLVACAGKSSDPPPSNTNGALHCLTTLASYCCASEAGAVACVGDFASASKCATWPSGTKLQVYPSACRGMTAVRVDAEWSTFYIYDASGSLLAVGDNAASKIDPRDTSIECGAGATSFTVPVDCGDAWLGTAGGEACGGGAAAPTSYCGKP
jgi:hypothetical protein